MPQPHPKPRNLHVRSVLEFDWTCPKCQCGNHSRRPGGSRYLRVRCGRCHWACRLEYNPYTDYGAVTAVYGRAGTGYLPTSPGVPQKTHKAKPCPLARRTMKLDYKPLRDSP